MPETLEKLRPDRDLQCFYLHDSAIAALSETSATGFKVTGTWRQQFDWTVIEWNRDNVYEHPAFRYLPDGDLSGLTLTYDESRDNCIGIDSHLSPTVDWPSLRIWVGDAALPVLIPIKDHATAIEGSYQCAYADFTLSGTMTAGDYVGIAHVGANHWYLIGGWETIEIVLDTIVLHVNAFSTVLKAERIGTSIRLHYTLGDPIATSTTGTNGNRFGAYSYSYGSGTLTWDAPMKTFSNGASPTKWQISLEFASLLPAGDAEKIRKMRWTYAAEMQPGSYDRREFEVAISNWNVTGTGRAYQVAGPQSRRIEDNDPEVVYTGDWADPHPPYVVRGNFSGGTIRYTTTAGDSLTCEYYASSSHTPHLGLRYTNVGAVANISVDGDPVDPVDLQVDQEDVLIRYPLGELAAGSHTITVTHSGTGTDLFFDFLELTVPATDLPTFPEEPGITLATDWDTDHSLAIAPERTAWFIDSLGFRGRQNHYVGALWFYELYAKNHVYASGTITFSGTPDPGEFVTLTLTLGGVPTNITKGIHIGETPETLAMAFGLEFNKGYNAVRAEVSGASVTILSRFMGLQGNDFGLTHSTTSSGLTITHSMADDFLEGGDDGIWVTDLTATPRINRAARDWSRSFFIALKDRGIDAVAAFSTELQHGDIDPSAGIAQFGPSGDAFYLPTPALQTNFSPTSLDFWKQVHLDQAQIMDEAGMTPYLQFGEVQWWYFPHNGFPIGHPQRVDFSGMPFYDDYTTSEFLSRYARPLPTFTTNTEDPVTYADEVDFLSTLIGEFTDAIIDYVRTSFATARFEVLYPTDVNQTPFNRAFNYPESSWTPAILDCLKTESFGFTFNRDLEKAEAETIEFDAGLGFPVDQRSHLIGIGDATAPWLKEMRIPQGRRFESVVLFALDQFCLIGYPVPLGQSARRIVRIGGH